MVRMELVSPDAPQRCSGSDERDGELVRCPLQATVLVDGAPCCDAHAGEMVDRRRTQWIVHEDGPLADVSRALREIADIAQRKRRR